MTMMLAIFKSTFITDELIEGLTIEFKLFTSMLGADFFRRSLICLQHPQPQASDWISLEP